MTESMPMPRTGVGIAVAADAANGAAKIAAGVA
eukprot:CAMPEP_0170596306 /NCGR_PEP_ID=MMETSP0224-20130122/15039_1 /TAXON_ID=285029 /ORGANISM="Togula jolla, Strain CCCM 725" /LENGTH=32 /DNA_ID= /DNA_START= /DNA_END= /DNA_ORIENTATION=